MKNKEANALLTFEEILSVLNKGVGAPSVGEYDRVIWYYQLIFIEIDFIEITSCRKKEYPLCFRLNYVAFQFY